uniref:Secreted protein n=1 Tax=Romanomermis culicivorax TaxID=13658 RepID=A0A915HVP9_ROMCU
MKATFFYCLTLCFVALVVAMEQGCKSPSPDEIGYNIVVTDSRQQSAPCPRHDPARSYGRPETPLLKYCFDAVGYTSQWGKNENIRAFCGKNRKKRHVEDAMLPIATFNSDGRYENDGSPQAAAILKSCNKTMALIYDQSCHRPGFQERWVYMNDLSDYHIVEMKYNAPHSDDDYDPNEYWNN